jgi:hypothetical protein
MTKAISFSIIELEDPGEAGIAMFLKRPVGIMELPSGCDIHVQLL